MNLNRLDLVSLRLYVAAVEGGSLTAGARTFGISVPAASKRIADLGASIGTLLLERGKQGVRPTGAGSALYRHAVQLSGDLVALASTMADDAQGVRGHVRIWANTSAVTGFLPGTLSRFLQDHPRVAIDLEETNSQPAVAAVADGSADLAVFAQNVTASGIRHAVCDIDQLVLVAAPGHPITRRRRMPFGESLEHDYVGLDRGSSLLDLARSVARRRGRRLNRGCTCAASTRWRGWCAAGVGIGMLPRTSAAPHVASMGLKMVVLTDPWASPGVAGGLARPRHAGRAGTATAGPAAGARRRGRGRHARVSGDRLTSG